MVDRDELIRKMQNTDLGVSDEALHKLQNAMQIEASKKKIQGQIDEDGLDKQALVGAIRNMMQDK